MKKILLLLIGTFITVLSFAQITVTDAVFPAAGDLLFTSRDSATVGVVITPPSATAQVWDFPYYWPQSADTTEILAASAGSAFADFPDADIILNFLGGEGYYDTDNSTLELLGFAGDVGFGIPVDLLVLFNPTSVQMSAPISYPYTFNDSYAFTQTLSADVLPFLDSLGLPIEIDSVRLNYSADRIDEVDAWGELTTYTGTFDVLRMKKEEITNTEIEILTDLPIVGPTWVDPGTLGFEVPGSGLDTTYTYDFISAADKEAIMSVNMDAEQNITSINYKVDPDNLYVNTNDIPDHSYTIKAYPNPVVNQLNIELQNLPAGVYTVQLYSILGNKIIEQQYDEGADARLQLDVSHLKQGSYLYSIANQSGEILTTKRFVKTHP